MHGRRYLIIKREDRAERNAQGIPNLQNGGNREYGPFWVRRNWARPTASRVVSGEPPKINSQRTFPVKSALSGLVGSGRGIWFSWQKSQVPTGRVGLSTGDSCAIRCAQLLALALCSALSAGQTNFSVLKFFGVPDLTAIHPDSRLTEGSDGALYGTTRSGGQYGWGTIFKMNKNGTGYEILHSFTGYPGDGAASPYSGVLEGIDGALYGATAAAVFRVNTDGSDFKVLVNFIPIWQNGSPISNLVEGTNGALYGVTYPASTNQGAFFKVNKDGSGYSVVRYFSGGLPSPIGSSPTPITLIQTADARLFSDAAAFKLKEGDGVIALTEGASIGGLLEGSDGVLYTANNPLGSAGSECGPDCGDIIAIRKDGTATVLHTFWSTNFDGALPQGSLVEGDDGALYGTTKFGGAGGLGVVFKLNKEGGSYRVLYSFNATTDAAAPAAGLLKASDGVLYGTTYFGGDRGLGTVFKINQDGSGYAVVFSFSVGDGRNPQTTVVEGSDGYLYGTTRDGGGYGYGSVYSLNKDGSSYSLIHSFNVIDGQQPLADVIEGSDGHLYGTTHLGGTKTFAYGTIFKMRKDGGAFTVLANFGDSSDPQQPRARLVEASDGVLYGTAVSGAFTVGVLCLDWTRTEANFRCYTASRFRMARDRGR